MKKHKLKDYEKSQIVPNMQCSHLSIHGNRCKKKAEVGHEVHLEPEIYSHDENFYFIFTCKKHEPHI